MTQGGFTMHYIHPSVFHLLSSHAPSHGVNYVCQYPFLPCMLYCGLCLPKGGPQGPVNMFLMFLVRKRNFCMHQNAYYSHMTSGTERRAYFSNLQTVNRQLISTKLFKVNKNEPTATSPVKPLQQCSVIVYLWV